jgi:hypothetical protein
LLDLQDALKGNATRRRQDEWFGAGGKEQWKYIYFSEGDQVLNARDIYGPAHKLMEEGGVLIPQRLQPIPHALDLMDLVEDFRMVPSSFNKDVLELSAGDGCCDTNQKPGQVLEPNCGAFWWQCGFRHLDDFRRLKHYQFVRLGEGTGIVNIAATAHSRKCIPYKGPKDSDHCIRTVEYTSDGVTTPSLAMQRGSVTPAVFKKKH